MCVKEASSFWGRFWSDESGSAAAEYVVILAIIGTAVALAVFVLSGAVATAINDAATCIETMGGTCN